MTYEEEEIQEPGSLDGPSRTVTSYHCGYAGCSVRYTPGEGYFTIAETPNSPHAIEEPGANTLRCPRHGTWLYRSYDENSGVFTSRCGIEDCDYFTKDVQAASSAGA
jgi:hypothetical protein